VRLSDFDFALPPEHIAQAPMARRDQSRLMIVNRAQQSITHDVFCNVGHYLRAGDVLVMNDTKVIPARLHGRKIATGGKIEVFLLHDKGDGVWEVLLKPAAKVAPGAVIGFGEGVLQGKVEARQADGVCLMRFTPQDILAVLDICGEVPLPPYIKRSKTEAGGPTPADAQRYQTVYARHPGAVAAPTAGLHFTPELLGSLQCQHIAQAYVTLHVGWGTFRPIRSETVEQHAMGAEFYQLSPPDACTIRQARQQGGRIVAVGTTVTRTLETIMQERARLIPHSGWSTLFIYPGYHFQAVELLITNFHLPRSTLFLLACAFGGRELMQKAYRTAIAEHYRFYSYGDAMLIY
jgi:S-adenosylmethionine:tRNA ribosyltransferase-isomerase